LSPLGKSEPIDIPPATFQSTTQSSNKTSQAKAIVSQSGSTATTTTTSSHSNTLSTTNHSSSSAATNPGQFSFNDLGNLMQGMQSMHGFTTQEAYEKFMQAKKRKDKRAKKNENKNVIAQVKAEEVDGYCGEKKHQ